ncbi:hypothetical protein [Blastomonas sp.]|uniref:hypothetical protein n=1 Tax=Blastomonas sp. TaxID=1909299 RepID=UPI003592EAD1
MMGFIQRLFGSKPSPSPSASVRNEPQTIEEVQAKTLLGFLIPQLQLLGFELEEVPTTGKYVSKRSRGYIYGLAAAILGATSQKINSGMVDDIMHTAFTLVWGRENAQRLFDMTLAECAARNGDTLAGSYRAEADVGEVFQEKPHAAVMGLWLLNNGLNNPEVIMPPIENPRPLPPSNSDPVETSIDDLASRLDEPKITLLCDCFGQIMMPQLEQLGIQPGGIEHSSLAGSAQACGYVQGLCAAIADASGFQPNDEYGVVLGIWAFDEMYGNIGQVLHRKTMKAIVDQDMSAIHGVLLAREDMSALSEKRPDYKASGFRQIASGSLFK